MAHAGLEGIKDGTLVQHIGASRLHITVGMVVTLVFAIPLGIHRQDSSWKQSTTDSTDKSI